MKKELVEMEFKMQEKAEDEENIRFAELQCKMLQLLLNNKITTFHFPPGLNSDSQTAASALCQNIDAEQMPDLHTIIRKCLFDRCWDVKSFFSTLHKFPNLEVLQLARFECDNAELCSIADQLPNLRYKIF
jgi:hypothetical protein